MTGMIGLLLAMMGCMGAIALTVIVVRLLWVAGGLWRVVGVFVLMMASGRATLVVAVLVLMFLGLSRYDNYEYYGKYPLLFLVPATAIFLITGLLTWIFTRKRQG